MDWCENIAFFCAATETARYVEENYYKDKTQLPEHPNTHTILNIDWNNLPKAKHEPNNKILTLLEVYIVSNYNRKKSLYKYKIKYHILF